MTIDELKLDLPAHDGLLCDCSEPLSFVGKCPHCGGPMFLVSDSESIECSSNNWNENMGYYPGLIAKEGTVEYEVILLLAKENGWDQIPISSIPTTRAVIYES